MNSLSTFRENSLRFAEALAQFDSTLIYPVIRKKTTPSKIKSDKKRLEIK